ncbi:hypothetical protein FQN54_001098 [Arachnomyces sp. PD_36]|nr:hypothetical protein FQN54_001098 [Arachnomyces sp. PD_36]
MPAGSPNSASGDVGLLKDVIKRLEDLVVQLQQEAGYLQQQPEPLKRRSRLAHVIELLRKSCSSPESLESIWRGACLQMDLVEILEKPPYYISSKIRNSLDLRTAFDAKNLQALSKSRARILVCQPNDAISSPRVRLEQQISTMFGKPEPIDPDIHRSALIIALLLVQKTWVIADSDLLHLLSPVFGDDFQEPAPALRDIITSWEPLARLKRGLISPRKHQAMTLNISTFPDLPLALEPDYRPSIAWEPDESRPPAAGKCVVWGSWDVKEPSSWNMVVAGGGAHEFQEFIRESLFQPLVGVASVPQSPSVSGVSPAPSTTTLAQSPVSPSSNSPPPDGLRLFSHWHNTIGGIVIPQIYMARERIRDAARTVENLKYKNTADPSKSGAERALLLRYYLQANLRLVETMKEEISYSPPAWGVLKTPDWAIAAMGEYEILQQEAEQVRAMADEVRQMIIEQYSLHQSRFLRILSILATIYVPLNFMTVSTTNRSIHPTEEHDTNFESPQSFFGMNLDKIKGSPPLPFKLFFIVAFPLVAATVIIPLVALPLFQFLVALPLVRFLVAKYTALQNPFKHLWILLTFTLYLIAEVLQSLYLAYLVTGLNAIHLSSAIAQRRRQLWQVSYFKKNWVWYILFVITVPCMAFGILYRWIGLAPYVLYYCVKIIYWKRDRRRNASAKISGR